MSAPKLVGQRCQCPECGEFFNRVSTFDKHRTGSFAAPGESKGDRHCQPVAAMRERGWKLNDAGFWITGAGNWRAAA